VLPQDVARVRSDVTNVLRYVGTLAPKPGALVLNTGRECRLLLLEGTVGIQYRGGKYNIPVEIFITEQYPAVPPMVYVRPTRDMDIKKGHK
jgi:ESCRT-I complex subunit TSG101